MIELSKGKLQQYRLVISVGSLIEVQQTLKKNNINNLAFIKGGAGMATESLSKLKQTKHQHYRLVIHLLC